MRALPSPRRKQLETAVLAARRAAESASRAAIDGLGVYLRDKPAHLDADQAGLRNGLRAKWRQLGGGDAAKPLLIAECAYEQWHRLLFARFLAENNLLLHPQYKAPVTVADCDDLAAGLGEPDGWSVAARFAAAILPGIFRLDDPCVRLQLAPEGRHALEEILDGLPADVFVADDALGWVYQFWQKDKKDEVNNSERKVGGADLGPVTQLFTENYMVRFLLENSLGAWWAARHPDTPLVKGFDYLRFDDDGRPAAGSFDGWPECVAQVTVMDPCCGSGHFLVEAFSMLWQMRAEEEGLSSVQAQDAVLRDNLFGLELDPRCVQIAMFAVALQTWKAGGGWRQLPVPNIACSGIPVKAPVEEWEALAGSDQRLANALARLHILFRDADTLGSLIDPKRATEMTDPTGVQRSLDDVEWSAMAPTLTKALESEAGDPATGVIGADAVAVARSADYLSRTYTLVATNVPYLTARKQQARFLRHLESYFGIGSIDLFAAMLLRAVALANTVAAVTPQKWWFLASFEGFRRHMIAAHRPILMAALGSKGFRTPMWDFPIGMTISTKTPSSDVCFLSAAPGKGFFEKPELLRSATLSYRTSRDVLSSPAAVFSSTTADQGVALSTVCDLYEGTKPGQTQRATRVCWEVPRLETPWVALASSPASTGESPYSGLTKLILIDQELRRAIPEANTSGQGAHGRRGLLIAKIGDLPASLYGGWRFDNNTFAIVPRDSNLIGVLWYFVRSGEFLRAARNINQKLDVSLGAVGSVPFDVDRWRRVAGDAGPLPEPHSDDPTQWLFEGRPEVSTAPLQVAVGRLVGYRWPEQPESDDLDTFVDADGIVCLPSVAGEAPAVDRVEQLLATAFGDTWSPGKVKDLLEQAGSKKKGLAEWLRDEFFKQHCALFHHRPFVWHIWDGQRDGFSALVNYHRLDRKMLEKLTYTYLGQDWVERQRAEIRDEVAGAEARLAAALILQRKLEAIIDGEKPYDIFVRWKELHEQPVGWEPDLNDGVRLNVRPFVEAGVLRAPFNIHWRKDRGRNPDGSERHNDVHLSLAEKTEARKRVGRA